ncbi:MAG: hypothetical protein SXV54_13955, partial [Chloroflexota bacterium]|nr:hypothetical protein [Chloroflexota bacterium]
MAMTRVQAETVIVSRAGPLMEAAGMVVTVVGTNADLNDSLAWATRKLGYTTADASTVSDTELASVAVAEYDDFLDLAEYRTLLSIVTNLDDVDIVAGPRAEKLSQLVSRVLRRIDRLEAKLTDILYELNVSYVDLDFA